MYSIMLMTALTTSAATPNFHWRTGGGYGGYGVYNSTCYGCYGGYGAYGSGGGGIGAYSYRCYGNFGAQGAFPQHHGDVPYNGCFGPLHPQFSTYGQGSSAHFGYGGYAMYAGHGNMAPIQCHGCYGAYAGWSCYGYNEPQAVQVAPPVDGTPPFTPPPSTTPPTPTPPPPPPPVPGGADNKGANPSGEARAQVVIYVPENGALFIDGQRMKDLSGRRVFQTPVLAQGQTYYYDVRIEVPQAGQIARDERKIVLRPGMEVTAHFPKLETATAAAK